MALHGRLSNWLQRHRHPASRMLHAIGIPLTVWSVVLWGFQLASWQGSPWWHAPGLLVGGYLLQWVGHRIEGNDMGEIILIKKALGRPYVAVAPRRDAEC